jgi:hypothetical protein
MWDSSQFLRRCVRASGSRAIVERAQSIRVVQEVEHVDRFLIPVSLGERIGVFCELGVWEDVAAPDEALTMLRVPDLAGFANREIRRDLRARLGLVKGAKEPASSAIPSSASSATACSTASASARAPAAGREGGRGKRETSDQQSAAERRNEATAPLAIELKKTEHRWILPACRIKKRRRLLARRGIML